MKKEIELAKKKIENDYNELFGELMKMEKVDLINNAYRIAHYNEIVDVFDCIDDEYPPFDKIVFENIASYEGNTITRLYDRWLQYSHPERYNFFTYEGLIDIIYYEYGVEHRMLI